MEGVVYQVDWIIIKINVLLICIMIYHSIVVSVMVMEI